MALHPDQRPRAPAEWDKRLIAHNAGETKRRKLLDQDEPLGVRHVAGHVQDGLRRDFYDQNGCAACGA